MPQPPANGEAAERLIRQYEQARDRLAERYAEVLSAPNRQVETARLRELIAVHDGTITELKTASRQWLAGELPGLHQAGAELSADLVGTSFRWTQEHRADVQQMAERSWDDVAARLREVDSTTRKVLRRELQDATRATLLESRTAVQAGRDLAKVAREAGLHTVTYSNGAKHSIADWADSAVRQVTAETYNRGSVEQCRTDGIEHVEYLDGPGCCVGPGHKNGPEANGLVVPLDEVVWTSHPRCTRSCAPAPEATPLPNLDRTPGPSMEPEPAPEPAAPARKARAAREPRTERTARKARA